jgi:small-conductance mechanosensitive channel
MPAPAATALLLILVLATTIAAGQEIAVPAVTPSPTPTPAPTPIPASEIPIRAVETRTLVRTSQSRLPTAEGMEAVAAGFATDREEAAELAEETRQRLAIEGPAAAIEETQRAWTRLSGRLDRRLQELQSQAAEIATYLRDLSAEREVWQLTRDAARELDLPQEVRQEIDEILAFLEVAEGEARAARDRTLVLQARVSRAVEVAGDLLAEQREEVARRRRGVVRLDSPPLWRALGTAGVGGAAAEQLADMWRRSVSDIRRYVREEQSRLLRHAALGGLTLILLLWLRRRAHAWSGGDTSLGRTIRVLERPLAAALVVILLLQDVLHPDAPVAWLDLLSLALLLAILRLLPLLVGPGLRSLALFLALLYLVFVAGELAPDGGLVDRLLMLVLALAAAATALWVHRWLTREPPADMARRWYQATVLGVRLAIAMFAVSAVANVLGAVGFASQLANETLSSVLGAVFFWVAADLARAVIRLLLLAAPLRRFAAVRLHEAALRSSLFRLVDLAAAFGWAVTTLAEFRLLGAIRSLLARVLGAELAVGALIINPGDILLFAVVVWLSFKLSRLVQATLDADVYTHMDLPKGVPGAINRLTHYALVVVGVMFAATAAGLDFTRLTFIIGALGVGIGFGLQNIVNNFVSGLILLFERPIRIGDRIELSSQLSGTVERIGIRASIVRTWQGAEVIVPNANLISSEVVNWTLSDDRRRMEIPVGVAYGTAPEVVLDLLLGVARAHAEVLDDPEPVALFTGFGDSSLNFELRAWTTGDIVVIPSELRVAINRGLAEAGIEIPFPQRDLHLRSVAPGAADRLGTGERSP